MENYTRLKDRGERLKRLMEESLDPDKAWDSTHLPHSPPRRYPNPNFVTNPDINDRRNFDQNGGNDSLEEDDDFYPLYSDEEENKK
jgi:hypothetical protein